MYYEETVAVTKKDRKKIVLYVILGFVFTYILVNVYEVFKLPFAGIARLCFYGVLAAGIYFAFRHGLIAYKYRIEGGKLIFINNSGSYDNVLAQIDAERVVCISRGAIKEKHALNAAKSSDESTRYTLVFTDAKGKNAYLIFEPSEAYLAKAAQFGILIQ